MTNPQTMNEQFKAIKTEGGQRSQKIADIFKSAFSEAMTEVKGGTQTVRPLAQELANNAFQVVKEKGQETYSNASTAARSTATDEEDMIVRLKLKLQAIVQAIQATLRQQPTETTTLVHPESTGRGVTVETTADPA